MHKLLGLISIAFSATCISATAGTYNPQFQVDYAQCDPNYPPVISGNAVQFGSGTQCRAGRVVSTNSYKNMTKVTATIDLSVLNQNYVNAAFYMVENNNNPKTQPIHDNYCDAGGNHNESNCREIDFLETNGNKIFQTTMHLGDGGLNAPQRYEYAYTPAADAACFRWGVMSDDPQHGLHSLAGNYPRRDSPYLDVGKPFTITTEFTYSPTAAMKTTVSQGNFSQTIYDTSIGGGAEGSGKLDYSDLIGTMDKGYWIIVSFWQNYSPEGPRSNKWWDASCNWGGLCNTNGFYWSISNIEVTAESELP